jgi:hypothetical protein
MNIIHHRLSFFLLLITACFFGQGCAISRALYDSNERYAFASNEVEPCGKTYDGYYLGTVERGTPPRLFHVIASQELLRGRSESQCLVMYLRVNPPLAEQGWINQPGIFQEEAIAELDRTRPVTIHYMADVPSKLDRPESVGYPSVIWMKSLPYLMQGESMYVNYFDPDGEVADCDLDVQWRQRSKAVKYIRRAGYVVTVPLDVVTFPIQLVVFCVAAATGNVPL